MAVPLKTLEPLNDVGRNGNNCLDKMRLRNYEEFKNTLKNALENQESYTYSQINQNKLCINSADVSNQIYKNLITEKEFYR